jgi:hypothetical protein
MGALKPSRSLHFRRSKPHFPPVPEAGIEVGSSVCLPRHPRLFPFILLIATFLAGPASAGSGKEESPQALGASPKKLSLDAWRSLKNEADEIGQLPRGPKRIAKCHALLKEHPDYPDPYTILRTLVDDTLETAGYDPGRVAALVERMHGARKDEYGRSALYLVEQYHLKHHLPLESADRLLASSRRGIEESRRLAEKEDDPDVRDQIDPAAAEFRLLLDEGRVLLARGDAAGAMKKLQEAEEKGRATGQFLQTRDARTKTSTILPAGSPLLARFDLTLAEAHLRLGNNAAAIQRLLQARDFQVPGDEMAQEISRLQETLKVPAATTVEVRAAPGHAGDFSLEDLQGKTVRLSDYRGRVVLVMLWTTW